MNWQDRNYYRLTDLAELAERVRVFMEPTAVQTRADGPAVVGQLLVREIQPGLFAAGYDVDCLADVVLAQTVEPSVICGIHLFEMSEPVAVDGYGDVSFEPGKAVLLGLGQRSRLANRPQAGKRRANAGFVLKAEFFNHLSIDSDDDDIRSLERLMDGEISIRTFSCCPALLETARKMLHHPYRGLLSDLFVESCTLALVADIGRLAADHRGSQRLVNLGRKQRERVHRAREILDERIVSPPSMRELSRQVGINATTLRVEFQQAYGTAVFGYVRERRMQIARVLLRTQEMPVSAIGYRVGFNNPAAFATAYRRRFGYPPSQEKAVRR